MEIKADNNSESADYYCDCPYDGSICKHVAAVALAINEEKTITISLNDAEPDEESWEQLIKDAKLKDLRNFMLDFGVKNQDFRHQIKLTFSKPVSVENADNIPYYQSQISGIFDIYDYRGFIDYRNSHSAMRDVNQFLYKPDNKSTILNNFIKEVEKRAIETNTLTEELQNWLAWAKQKADWYNPFIKKADEFLTDNDRLIF